MARQSDHTGPGYGIDKRLERSPQAAPKVAVLDLDAVHPGRGADALDRRLAGELDFDAVHEQVVKLAELDDPNQSRVSDDRGPLADAFDLHSEEGAPPFFLV